MDKTALTLAIVVNAVLAHRTPALVFSLETPR